jgi:DNA-binding transcriptional LysR family regulator
MARSRLCGDSPVIPLHETRRNVVELRQLRYFVAVAEELHFRRAAERLYVAQPAVSEQVRKLEAELGVRLFERTNRSVVITDAGAALLEEGRLVLEQAEAAQRAARGAGDRIGARLRIGHLPDALPPEVPRALAHLRGSSATVRVSTESAPAARLADAVRAQRLDAAIVDLPVATHGLRVTPLAMQHLVVALPTDDPRAQAPSLRLSQLAPDRLVAPPAEVNPAFHATIVALLRRDGLSPAFVEVGEARVDSMLLAVAASGVLALLPTCAASRATVPGVRLVPLDEPEPVVEPAVLTLSSRDHLPTAAFLRALGRFTRSRPAEAMQPAMQLVA